MTSSLLAVSGSLRAGSANTGLVRMAERLAPAHLSVTVRDGIDRLPYYNADLEALVRARLDGIVAALSQRS